MLTAPDHFLRNLSPFDRAARLKTNGPVNPTDFTNFIARQILPWSEMDRRRLGGLSQMESNRLAGWSLPLAETISLIKTTGEEEGNTAYTRGSAIIIPVQMPGEHVAPNPEILSRMSETLRPTAQSSAP